MHSKHHFMKQAWRESLKKRERSAVGTFHSQKGGLLQLSYMYLKFEKKKQLRQIAVQRNCTYPHNNLTATSSRWYSIRHDLNEWSLKEMSSYLQWIFWIMGRGHAGSAHAHGILPCTRSEGKEIRSIVHSSGALSTV